MAEARQHLLADFIDLPPAAPSVKEEACPDWQRKKRAEVGRKMAQDPEWRRKVTEGVRKVVQSPGWRRNHAEAMRKLHQDPEWRRQISENNPMKRPEVAAKQGETQKGENNPMKRPEVAAKHSGENGNNWHGGISFEPYCPAFNNAFKRECRASWGNVCVICGQRPNGSALSIHHIHYDKGAGCNGRALECVPLCPTHHSKSGNHRGWWIAFFEQLLWNSVRGWHTDLVPEEG